MPDEPILLTVVVQVAFGAGVDDDSDMKIVYENPHETNNRIGVFNIDGIRAIGDGSHCNIQLNWTGWRLAKSQVTLSYLYLEINAFGRDHCDGSIIVQHTFTDGSVAYADCGNFGIGTYQESNNTRLPIRTLSNTPPPPGGLRRTPIP